MFHPGDRVQVIAHPLFPVEWSDGVRPGLRGMVVSEEYYANQPDHDGNWSPCVDVDFGSFVTAIATLLLRKLDSRPECDQVSTWDQCPWQPSREKELC